MDEQRINSQSCSSNRAQRAGRGTMYSGHSAMASVRSKVYCTPKGEVERGTGMTSGALAEVLGAAAAALLCASAAGFCSSTSGQGEVNFTLYTLLPNSRRSGRGGSGAADAAVAAARAADRSLCAATVAASFFCSTSALGKVATK